MKNLIYIELVYSYRYGTIYREVIHSPKLEFCGIMEGSLNNPFLSSIINEIRDSVPELFHKCPYEGEIDLMNLTTAHEKATAVFWDGYYKFELFVWKNNIEVFYLNLKMQIKTHLKDSFG